MKKYAVILGFVIALGRFLYKQDKNIQVNERDFTSDRIPETFDSYRIIHVSDYHNAWFGWKAKDLLNKIRQADGDIILITGDIIDRRTPNLRRSKFFIRQVAEILPTYYVTGNHEAHYKRWFNLKKYITESDMENLSFSSAKLFKDGESINLAGIPDPWFLGDEEDPDVHLYFERMLQQQVDSLPEGFTILMSHRPELFHIYSKYELDLVLSGHAHGGQIRLPFAGGLYSPHQGVLPKYTQGTHYRNKTTLSISRGLGNSRFPFRVFNRPEIVVITLKKK